MLRFIYTIIINLFRLPYYCYKMKKHGRNNNRTEEENYEYARKVVNIINKTGRIKPIKFGLENIPTENGYFIISNHQGRYDTHTIVTAHDNPLAYLIEKRKSEQILTNSFTVLLHSKRLDLFNLKDQIKIYNEITEEVKNGRNYVIFPEGQYEYENTNDVHDFNSGCMGCILKAKMPILPVVLINSFKTFTKNTLKTAHPEVHFLKPIYYDEYKHMNKKELANYLRNLIKEKINEILYERNKAF